MARAKTASDERYNQRRRARRQLARLNAQIEKLSGSDSDSVKPLLESKKELENIIGQSYRSSGNTLRVRQTVLNSVADAISKSIDNISKVKVNPLDVAKKATRKTKTAASLANAVSSIQKAQAKASTIDEQENKETLSQKLESTAAADKFMSEYSKLSKTYVSQMDERQFFDYMIGTAFWQSTWHIWNGLPNEQRIDAIIDYYYSHGSVESPNFEDVFNYVVDNMTKDYTQFTLQDRKEEISEEDDPNAYPTIASRPVAYVTRVK